jgi:hypothetical protein
MPSPFSWLQQRFGTQPGERFPAWTQMLPGPAGITFRIMNNASANRYANPDWAANAASGGGPGFDPASLDTPPPQYGPGQVPGGIDISGEAGQASPMPDFLKQFFASVGRPDYVGVNPPSTSIPYAPGQYPIPGGGDMRNAAGDWRENATKIFNPITGGMNWRSEPRGFFGAQTVSGFPMWEGFGSAGGGSPWRTLLA